MQTKDRARPGHVRMSIEVDAFTKRCQTCGRVLHVSQFPRRYGRAHSHTCRPCWQAKSTEE